MKRLSLRLYFFIILAAGLVVITVISTLLWQASNRMTEIANFMQNGVESVSLAQTVRASLDGHRRQSLMHELEQDNQREQVRIQEEQRLAGFVTEMGRLSSSARERRAVEQTLNAIREYLDESRALRAKGYSGVPLWSSTTAIFDRATSALQRLIDINVEQTIAMEREAVSEGQGLRKLLAAAFFIIAASVAMLFWLFRRSVYLPLMNMRRAISEYSASPIALASDSTAQASKKTGLREISEIAKAFRNLRERLARQNEQRLLFMSTVAHDLKNPLGAIEMSLDLLSVEARPSEAERVELSAIMHRQMKQLRNLVDDILDSARIEAGNLELKKSERDLRELVRDSARIFSSLSAKHRVDIQLPLEPVELSIDPHRIGQVLNNLLSNAIKYSPAGGVVAVRLTMGEREALVSVADQGLGIEPDELEHIFEPFRRALSSREKVPGVGLGLTTAKKIIEAHNGKIEVSSRCSGSDAGTTFIVRLPLTLRAERRDPASPPRDLSAPRDHSAPRDRLARSSRPPELAP